MADAVARTSRPPFAALSQEESAPIHFHGSSAIGHDHTIQEAATADWAACHHSIPLELVPTRHPAGASQRFEPAAANIEQVDRIVGGSRQAKAQADHPSSGIRSRARLAQPQPIGARECEACGADGAPHPGGNEAHLEMMFAFHKSWIDLYGVL